MTHLELVFLVYVSAQGRVTQGGGAVLARPNYHGFHVANVLSDPPSPPGLMETEAALWEPSPSDTVSSDKEQGVCER